MEIITKAAKMRLISRKLWMEERSIGFVPTMGALHEGHLSMIRDARRMSDVVIVSIFVNQYQLDSGQEFDLYPRDLARDADQLTPIDVDYIFAPSREEMYPAGFASYVEVEGLSGKLEGQSRPGHFRNAVTALNILLNIVNPQFLFVGQRDAQQAAIIKKLVRDLQLPVEVIISAIAREADGLACASRNELLSPEERAAAPALYRALHLAEELFANGERRASKFYKAVRKELDKEPLAKIDYLAITDTDTLEPLDDLEGQKALVSVAAQFGNTRLIDNVVLKEPRLKGKTGMLKLG